MEPVFEIVGLRLQSEKRDTMDSRGSPKIHARR